MLEELIQKTEQDMQKTLEKFKDKIKKIRTGRANVSILEGVKVSCYGNLSDLHHVASLSCPDARTIMISPWDQNVLKDIEEALIKSSLGMIPQNDGKVIRLKVPELTEDRRKEIVKNFKKDVERFRIELRQIRQDANGLIRTSFKEKKISEDESKRAEDRIQKKIDLYNEKISEVSDQKEKEITRV